MNKSTIDKIVSQIFTEKALRDFYCIGNTCAGWERNVVDQPAAVNGDIGTSRTLGLRSAAEPGRNRVPDGLFEP